MHACTNLALVVAIAMLQTAAGGAAMTLPLSRQRMPRSLQTLRGATSPMSNQENSLYVGVLSVGRPAREARVVFDTGAWWLEARRRSTLAAASSSLPSSH